MCPPPVHNGHIFCWCCCADGVTCCSATVLTLDSGFWSLHSATFKFKNVFVIGFGGSVVVRWSVVVILFSSLHHLRSCSLNPCFSVSGLTVQGLRADTQHLTLSDHICLRSHEAVAALILLHTCRPPKLL